MSGKIINVKITVFVLLSLLLPTISTAEAPEVAADIVFARDTVITGEIVIGPNRICQIKQGVTISFADYGRIAVYGVLIAAARADSQIVITFLDRPGGATTRPQWKGIEILGKNARAEMSHCRIEGAYRNLVWEASPVFDSCSFTGNHYALYCGNKAKAHIKNCTFYNNTFGVTVDLAAPLLLDNNITGNTVGLYLLLCSESIVGRNVIKDNKTDIKTETSMSVHKGSLSMHYLWNVMNQLY